MRAVNADALIVQFRRAIETFLPNDPRKHMTPVDSLKCHEWERGLMVIQDAPIIYPEPHWIPVTEEPKESGKYLVTAIISFVPDHVDDPNTYKAVTTANYLADIRDHPIKWCGNNVEKVLAWMPLPEKYED